MLSVRPTRPCNHSLQRMKEWKGEGRAGVPAALVWFDADSRAAGFAAFGQLDALVGDRREAGPAFLQHKKSVFPNVTLVPIKRPIGAEARTLFYVGQTMMFCLRRY